MNRKVFLKQALVTSLVIASTPSVLSGRKSREGLVGGRKFKTLLNGGLIGVRANQVQLIELAHIHGFESVVALPNQLGKLTDKQLEDLVINMASKKVSFGLGELNVEYRKTEDIFRKGLADLPARCKVLQRLGITRSMTWIMSNHSELNYLQNFRQHTSRLREIALVLNDHGIRYGLEYVGPKSIWSANKFPFIHSMAETQELIAAIGVPNVGLHLDTAHWFTAGETLQSILSLSNKDIVGCDLNDAIKGIVPIENQPGYERELPASTGVIDTKGFLEALIAIGYDGFIQAEPFNEELNKLEDDAAVQKTAEAMKMAVSRVG